MLLRRHTSLLRRINSSIRFNGKLFSSIADDYMKNARNIGISAHIDSGKTTLTERILFYSGKISSIHDVRGKDGVGATMDSMDLEREKGITIQSAATFCSWKDTSINIIDTPGHVDFTIEVERALRVLDGAIMVVCGVSGVQSQTLTVDRQMKRYRVPRIAFINKLDRMGANPFKAIKSLRKELGLPAVAVQIPIGVEAQHNGVIDLLTKEAVYFNGDKGQIVERTTVLPSNLVDECNAYRKVLIESLANVDEVIEEKFLMEEEPTVDELRAAIRRATLSHKFIPVMMGSAYKNKGIQELLDGVASYLPNPREVDNFGLDLDQGEEKVKLPCDPNAPLVALAFKLDESKFGQLTYIRIYQGTLRRGATAMNVKTGKKVKFPRLVRMHSSEMVDVDSAGAGDVVAVFGVECSSMDTFTDGPKKIAMESMYVPNPVMSLSIKPKDNSMMANFSKAIGKFTREDPTLRIEMDKKTNETILSGMGELHLEIYIERMKREYNVEAVTGQPTVNYKETITQRGEFNYLHKKQSGGSGQYAKVIGFIEPLEEELIKKGVDFEFENRVIGTNIPSEYISSCEKGARSACAKGALAGYTLTGVRVVILDGAAHAVDSNDLSFQLAMNYGIREGVQKAKAQILEPIMNLEVSSPTEFQGTIIGGINKRNGVILSSDLSEDGSQLLVKAEVPLAVLFGYSTDLRSSTQGKGEYAMEYNNHAPVSKQVQLELIKKFQDRLKEENDE